MSLSNRSRPWRSLASRTPVRADAGSTIMVCPGWDPRRLGSILSLRFCDRRRVLRASVPFVIDLGLTVTAFTRLFTNRMTLRPVQ